jgi:class 3 adenylate cyclase
MLAFALSHSTLSAIQAPDELLKSGLTSYFIAGNKSLIMIAMGAITGGVSRISRRLLLRVLEEEREKEVVQRVFGQYVSEVVSDRILSRATNMTGESAHVVILFSDLRGFSAFSEGRDPAEIVSRLNAYFERMVAAIRSEHGVVDKFIGDAVMAVFGGLVELEDPATSAVRAARKMRTSLTELNAEWAKAGLEPFDNGIGLHIGEVILGPLGCEDRMEFTAIGDAVNTAARLEGLCKDKAFPLLITGALYDELEAGEREGFESLGEVSVKGKQVPLRVYGTHG